MFKKGTSRLSHLVRGGKRSRTGRVRTAVSSALAVAAVASLSVLGQGTASATPLPPSWKLVFNSNFSGTKLNTKVWTTCFPWATTAAGCTEYGSNGEDKEWYLPSQAVVSGGVLHLIAERKAIKGTNARGKPKEYACRSGMVTTFRGFKFKYGFVQITARLPFSAGLWPTFWLAAANEKWPPEIDILEHWGDQTVSKLYLHPLNGPRQGAVYNAPTADSGWHTWRLYWTKTRLTWCYDGIQKYATTKDIPQQPMYFIANLADTNNPAVTCNGTLLVQSVKVWQP